MNCQHRHTHQMQELTSLTSRLRCEARKITGPRAAILEILRHHPHPLTNRQIFEELPPGECDLATIYRTMQMLEKLGMVKRFVLGGSAASFELVREGDDGHQHHLICTSCAEVVKIKECFPPETERLIACSNGFAAVTHRLEFFGLCPSCQV